MYLGLVFFIDISHHKTGTSLLLCTSHFLFLSPLPHPTSFMIQKLDFTLFCTHPYANVESGADKLMSPRSQPSIYGMVFYATL